MKKQILFLLLIICSFYNFAQTSSTVYMTGEVVSMSADNLLTLKNVEGDIPGTKDTLSMSKIIDMSTVFPNMKGEMTIGVATGLLKSKTGKTAIIKIIKYTSKVGDDHIIKPTNKLKIGWSSPERAKLAEQYKQGNEALQKKQYEEAITLFESALAIDSNHAASLRGMASANLRLGNGKESMNYYDRAIKQEPEYYQTRFDRALLCYRLSKNIMAILDSSMYRYAQKGLEDVNALLSAYKNKTLNVDDSDLRTIYQFRVIFKVIGNKQSDCCSDIKKVLSLGGEDETMQQENIEFLRLKELYCTPALLSKKPTKYHELTVLKQYDDGDTLEVLLSDSINITLPLIVKSSALKTGDSIMLGNAQKVNLIAIAKVIGVEDKKLSIRVIRWNMTEKDLKKTGASSGMQIKKELYCPVRNFRFKENIHFYCFW